MPASSSLGTQIRLRTGRCAPLFTSLLARARTQESASVYRRGGRAPGRQWAAASRLKHTCYVTDDDVAMRIEPALGGQLARAHLEPRPHQRAIATAS